MQTEHPHEISRDEIPEKGSISLTETEARFLQAQTPEERGKWLRNRKPLISRADMQALTNLPIQKRGDALARLIIASGWTPPGGTVNDKE